ncbi:MAG: DUF2147 domain-containing protein [Sulfurifustaceae bacterium]
MKTTTRALLMLSLFIPLLATGADPDAILGVWTTAEGKSRVEISKKDGQYQGKIIALKEPLYPTDANDKQYVAGRAGQPKVDRNNPDEKLRERPIVGLDLLSGFRYDGDDVWSGGTIYDPESGKTYKCKLTLVSPNELKVRGYVGVSLLGRTTVWTR